MSCTNNLKQLALAVHNYHDAHNRVVPHGPNHGAANFGQRYSFLVLLCPFIEQPAIYDEAWSTDREASAWFTQRIAGFLCPSDSNASRIIAGAAANTPSSPTNYHCSAGDTWNYWELTKAKRGFFCREINGERTFASTTDGLSNTILLGEVVTASNLSQNSGTTGAIKGSVASISAIKTNNAATLLPKTCADSRIAGNQVGNGANVDCDSVGTRWADAWDVYSMFSCVLPPNSPSCSTQGPNLNWWSERFALVTLSSFHTGGANVAFADGSVHFLSETINCETAGTTGLNYSADEQELVKLGQSPYGITVDVLQYQK